MTKTYIIEKVQVVQEKKKFVACICDKCGIELPEGYADVQYFRRDLVVKLEVGDVYSDSGSGTGWRINDLCDACIVELKFVLVRAGFRIEDYDWDY